MPRKVRYLEDLEIGEVFNSRQYRVRRAEMVEFAERYDPQSFHTGIGESENITPLFGEVTSSGYHSAAICMRLLYDTLLADTACLTSPGLDYLKWRNPIRDGDAVKARFEIVEKRLSKSDPTRGIVKVKEELFNQQGDLLLESVKVLFIGSRNGVDMSH